MRIVGSFCFLFVVLISVSGQSARAKRYSESRATTQKTATNPSAESSPGDENVIKVETDLVIVPFRVTNKRGLAITDIAQHEVRVFESGEEREIAFFANIDQPFTVALVLDVSYSTVFKLKAIQDAAKKFVSHLRADDRVMVVTFSERPMVMCEPTGDRRVLDIAIDAAKVGSGTGLYMTLDMVLNEKLSAISGRKAVVLLTDGVDTASVYQTARTVMRDVSESDAIIYTVRYDTYDDVQKTRREIAPVQFDENDKPYTVETRRVRGEREEDYVEAKEFLRSIAEDTGGRTFTVNSTTNLDKAFGNIANELRKIYTLGYYPSGERVENASFEIKVRIYRPDLTVRSRERVSSR